MGVEKEPLTENEFNRILREATKLSNEGNDEPRKILLMLRWTGMHVSVLSEPNKHNLHTETINGIRYIVWYRPKKTDKKARTQVAIHKSINFDVDEYIEQLKRRRNATNRRKISRRYFYEKIKELGERAGVPGISPMSLRHTFGVGLATQGYPREYIKQKMNCSDRVLQTYLQYSTCTEEELLKKKGWID